MSKDKKKFNYGPILIILAACFWGSMGIFVRNLTTYGFTSIQIVAIRVTLAALVFSLILLIKDRKGFKISPKDIPLFLGLGLGSILFFTVCYFVCGNYDYATFHSGDSFIHIAVLDNVNVGIVFP